MYLGKRLQNVKSTFSQKFKSTMTHDSCPCTHPLIFDTQHGHNTYPARGNRVRYHDDKSPDQVNILIMNAKVLCTIIITETIVVNYAFMNIVRTCLKLYLITGTSPLGSKTHTVHIELSNWQSKMARWFG